MNEWWRRGFSFAGGAICAICVWGLGAMIIQFATAGDEADGAGARSNMALRVNHGTGCQYLESSRGSLTPRMGRDGKQACKGGV